MHKILFVEICCLFFSYGSFFVFACFAELTRLLPHSVSLEAEQMMFLLALESNIASKSRFSGCT